MSAIDSALLAVDPTFIKRVRVLACKSCIAVASEPYGGQGQPTAAQHNKRIAYSNRFLLESEGQAVELAWGVVAGGIITSESIDSDIEFTINSIYDAFSGIVPAAVA